ncbi:MAG: RNA polymerase sigma factor SigX [Caldibacillus sp.]
MDALFEEIYEKYHLDIFQFLFYLVRDRHKAEDLTQEVYIRVLKSIDRFEHRSSLKTWILAIARNVAIDHFRKEKKKRNFFMSQLEEKGFDVQDHEKIPEEIAIQKDEIRLLYRCLKACTLDQQTVLIARFIQDLSIAETAEILGWTESKVKTTQHRAIRNLKKFMEAASEKEGGQHE